MEIFVICELSLTVINNCIILIKYLNGELSRSRLWVIVSIAIFPSILFILKKQFIVLLMLISFLFPLLVIKKMKVGTIIYITAIYQAILLASTSSIILLVNCFSKNEIVKYIIDIIINLIVLLAIVLINKERTNRIITNFWEFTGKGIKVLILLTLFISGILSVVLSYIPEIHSFDIWYRLLSFLFVIIIVASCLIYPICISNIITKNYYKTINAVTNRQLKTQIEYYNVLNDKTRDLRVFKHNFKNTLIVLETHLKNNDLESAKKFINKSNNQLDYLNTFNTGSSVLDALLFEKRRIANSYNIELEFSGSIKTEIIDDIDLCIIFGNSIDNAIEACQKLNNEIQRIIDIKIRYLNNLVDIIITNPTLEHINIQENTMRTTKSDATNHGFGLESIYNIAEKYSGDAEIYYKDNLFTLNIVIPTN